MCISAVIAELMMQNIPHFSSLRGNAMLRRDVFAAACAAGVAATFGAPIGGVLFSIEITSTFYLLEHLTFAFFTATLTLVWTSQLLLLVPGAPLSLSLFTQVRERASERAIER